MALAATSAMTVGMPTSCSRPRVFSLKPSASTGTWIAAASCGAVSVPRTTRNSPAAGSSRSPSRSRNPFVNGHSAANSQA